MRDKLLFRPKLLLTGTHYNVPVLSIGTSFVLALLAILPSTKDEEFIAYTSRTPAITYDFIVVGSGTAGGVIAARLAEIDSCNILLLEAGGLPEHESSIPGFALQFFTPQSYFSYKTVPQKKAFFAFENNKFPSCKNLLYGSDEYWRCFIRNMARPTSHPVGTCKMASATDSLGVVDSRLRVRGVTGLRVADASIIPLITSGNINAVVLMIGEKAADLIKEDHGIATFNESAKSYGSVKKSPDVSNDHAKSYSGIINDFNAKPADLLKVILGEKIIDYISQSKAVSNVVREIHSERTVEPVQQNQYQSVTDPTKENYRNEESSVPIEMKNLQSFDQKREYKGVKSASLKRVDFDFNPTFYGKNNTV